MPDLNDDSQLLREIGLVDPVPERITAYAEAVYGLLASDPIEAVLAADSAADRELVSVRDDARTSRVLEYAASGTSLEIQIVQDGTMIGQLVPMVSCEVQIFATSGTVTLRSDEYGSFSAPCPPASFVVLARTEPAPTWAFVRI